MPARHFLCCLPLRLGALLISLAQLGLFGLVAAASWYFISTMRTSPMNLSLLFFFPDGDFLRRSSPNPSERGYHYQCYLLHPPRARCAPRVSPIIPSQRGLGTGDSFFLLIFIPNRSLFGTIARKASLLSTYAFALGWAIGFQLVIDVIYMIGIFSQSHQKLVDRCINGSTDQDVKDLCNNFFSSRKWALLAGMIISLIIQFCESPFSRTFFFFLVLLTFFKGPHASSMGMLKN